MIYMARDSTWRMVVGGAVYLERCAGNGGKKAKNGPWMNLAHANIDS
jgi:hypothetical protein